MIRFNNRLLPLNSNSNSKVINPNSRKTDSHNTNTTGGTTAALIPYKQWISYDEWTTQLWFWSHRRPIQANYTVLNLSDEHQCLPVFSHAPTESCFP
ncbi:hypothetical protein M378DRAFT_167244 [Amanita muscaria Koide BX008]|uniref:Uncharacterized protein n=1 Tax=Amanita muscaria (strain Koide BX008) TaxID=946122 RepID=A0A0C2WXX4_AMAMK|nr:hypothetical protein M378DRAFT_167244 [Amanita muscaria Koide BX008]